MWTGIVFVPGRRLAATMSARGTRQTRLLSPFVSGSTPKPGAVGAPQVDEAGAQTHADERALATTQVAPSNDRTLDDVRPVDARVSSSTPITVGGGRYEIVRLLGEGGMGEVHECEDLEIERTVALKTIRRDRQARHLVARFVREACVQAQLEHPSVVPVFDVSRDGESQLPFFTMRKVGGISLDEVLERKRSGDPRMMTERSETFSRHRLLTAFVQVCLTVHYAHSRGVLHRDIKPSNIMLGDFGEVYVLDWGLAKLAPEPRKPVPPSSSSSFDAVADVTSREDQTQAGTALGTPAYMAPEQFAGREIDARADVFALGAVLFEILTLEPLLDQSAIEARLRGEGKAKWDARPTVRAPNRSVPPEFDRICVRATAEAVEKRYASARALQEAVEAFLDGERDQDLRRNLAMSLLANAEEQRLTDRDEALRQVNRALALSPDNPRALELLVELLKETPASTARAQAEVKAGAIERQRASQYLGTLLYLAPWVTLYPVILYQRGVWSWIEGLAPPVAWLVACIAILIDNRQGTHEKVTYPTLLVMVAVGVTSILHGPLLTVPALATTSAATHVLVGTKRLRLPTLVYAAAAIVVPMLLVWLGLWTPYRFLDGTGETIVLRSVFRWVLPARFALVLTGADMLLLVLTLIFASSIRDQIEKARAASVFFAWQLSKLLPPAADASVGAVADPEPPPPSSKKGGGAPSVARLLDTAIDSKPLRAIDRTTLTRAGDDGSTGGGATFPLLSLEGARYVNDELILETPSMGTVHRVHDRLIGRDVAMRRPRSSTLREAMLQAKVEHPAVPPIYETGRDENGQPWFTMQLVRGTTLADLIRQSGVSASATHGRHQRLTAFAKVCLAIDYAHQHGIVHDALEPGNIVLGEFGEVYILGWSHARRLEDPVEPADFAQRNAEYTAPELLSADGKSGEGDAPNVRTDVYSLGAILFEVASGQRASSGAPLPDVLDDICLKAMATDPSQRYRSARKLHDAIEAFMSADRDEDLRRALAAERLARAAKKVKLAESSESDDGIERVEALRDIGRALALAPDRTPALSLLSKLLAMTPTKLPREVREEITQQIWRMSANTMYAAVASYLVLFLVMFPIYSFIVGVRRPAHVAAVVVAWAIAAFVLYGEHAFTKRPVKTPIAAVTSLLAVGVTSLIMGPNLLVPGLAIIVSMVCILAVQPEWRRLTFAVAVLVVLVPSILNWIGIMDVYELPGIGRTNLITLIIRGADYHPPWVFQVFLPLLHVLTVLFAVLFASKYRDMLDDLEADNRAKVLGLQRLL